MPSTVRIFYIWHLLNGLTHLLFESTYIYNCFNSYVSIPPQPTPPHLFVRFFLGHRDRLYGNAYSDNIISRPWHEVAKADSRYAGIDLTTLSLEILTVFLAGPLSLYIANSIRQDAKRSGRGDISGTTWFWAIVLASGELYGGLMNFLPEWLTGCESLDTENPVHLWFHIVFFNAIWVFFPLWVLRRAYSDIRDTFRFVERTRGERYSTGNVVLQDEKGR